MTRAFAAALFIVAAFTAATPATASSTADAGIARPAAQTAATPSPAAAVPVAAGDQLSFIDRYFPLRLPNDLEPEVERNIGLIWVLSITLAPCWASLWAPMVLTGQGMPADFLSEFLVSGILHYLTNLIPFVGGIMVWVNCLYLCPVATIAIYDRNLKIERGKSVTADSRSPADETRSALALVPVTAMAY